MLVGGGGAWLGFEPTHKHTSAHQSPLVWRAPEGPEGLAATPAGGGGAWPGFEATRKATHQRPGLTGVEGAGGSGGPGCDTRGQRRGLVAVPVGGGRARAGLEIDHSEPSGSRVAISRAGRRPPALQATWPTGQAGITKPPGPNGAGRQWR